MAEARQVGWREVLIVAAIAVGVVLGALVISIVISIAGLFYLVAALR